MDHFQRISEELACHALDAVILTGEANRFYASGFHSTGGDGVAVVTPKKCYYFTDSRYTEAAGRMVRNAEIREVGRGRGYGTLIREALAEQGALRVGFEDAVMSVREHAAYAKALPGVEMLAASDLLSELRQSKDSEELACMERAQRIAEAALDRILTEIHPGVTEREIAARLQYFMLSDGAENMSFDPIVVSGPNGSLPHGVPGDRKIESGEFVTMDFGCISGGYCSDMTRTVAVGAVSDEMVHVYETVLQAQLAGIEAARPGVSGSAVDGAARSVIEAAGYGSYFGHSFGHGVGVEIHEAPNATPGNDEPLPEGAVISAEPGIYLPGRFGVRIEDVVCLKGQGCINLTRAPKKLLVL